MAQHSVAFDWDDATDLAEQFPGVALPDSLGRAVRKRQAEFLAGRYCVREAMRACGPEHADLLIAVGRNREPVWPEGIVGAITHTHHFASAALARSRDARGIGLDAELVMTDDLATRLLDKIATLDEASAVARKTGWGTGLALTVIFSAKETVFKCLYPQVGRYFGFHAAVIDVLDPDAGRFSARLLETLTPSLAAGLVLEGRFERDARSVCTAMILTP